MRSYAVRGLPEAPARPGLSFTLCVSEGAEPGGKCGVGQLVMTHRAPHSAVQMTSPGPPAITALRRIGALIVTVAPMPTRRHYRRPNPDRRRALELLAGSRYGYTKAILRAHGFSFDMMVELIKAGLATTKRKRMVADSRQTGVVRVRITEAGRQALAKMSK